MDGRSLQEKVRWASRELSEILQRPRLELRHRRPRRNKQMLREANATVTFDERGPIIECQTNASYRTVGHEGLHIYNLTYNGSALNLYLEPGRLFKLIPDVPERGLQDDTFTHPYAAWVNAASRAVISGESVAYGFNALRARRYSKCIPAEYQFQAGHPEDPEFLHPAPIRREAFATPERVRERIAKEGFDALDKMSDEMNDFVAYDAARNFGYQLTSRTDLEPQVRVVRHPGAITVLLHRPMRPLGESIELLRSYAMMDASALVEQVLDATQRDFDCIAQARIRRRQN